MARRRAGAAPANLRAVLADRYREDSARYAEAMGWTEQSGPWGHRIRALERGEPVEFSGSELAGYVPGVAVNTSYIVDADGAVSEAPPRPPSGLNGSACR